MYSLVGVHNFENDVKLKFGQSFETKNVQLYPDRYMITVQGTNLSNTEIAVTSNANVVYRTVKNDYAVLVFDASDIIEKTFLGSLPGLIKLQMNAWVSSKYFMATALSHPKISPRRTPPV